LFKRMGAQAADRRPSRRALAVATVVVALASAPGASAASTPGVGSLGQARDTDFTPIAKDGTPFGWTMFDGALFGQNGKMVEKPAPSQTPFTVDFFTVRFVADGTSGFAGGAACKDAQTPFKQLDSCQRVPAIWQFKDESWQQVPLPGGADDPGGNPTAGYVGALAYMADGKVLAVGGDGVYPRRELACSAAAPSGCVDDASYRDPAGHPRAWLYDGSGWNEISNRFEDPSLAPGGEAPGGLTALACSPRKSDYSGEFCAAGGLHQFWAWQSRGLAASYDDKSATGWAPTLGSSPDFHFRVRDIRWARNGGFVAVTAGCCGDPTRLGATAGPRLLTYTDYGDQWKWSSSVVNAFDFTNPMSDPMGATGSTSSTIADS
jgi:hypothetical protein